MSIMRHWAQGAIGLDQTIQNMVAKCVINNANSLRWFDQVQAPCEKQTSEAVSRRPIRIHAQNISSKGKAEPYIAPGFNFRSSY